MTTRTGSLRAPVHALDAISAIEAIENRYDAYAFLRGETKDAGFDYFIVSAMPAQGDQQIGSHLLVTSLPDAFIAEFDNHHMAVNSAIFAALRSSVRPVPWVLEEATQARPDLSRQRIVDLFKRYRIASGLHVPVHDHAARRGFVAFLGSRPRADFFEVSRLALIGNCVFDRLSGGTVERRAPLRLTERERETLVWTAAGKTSGEIGTILGLSEHTVNQYVAAACQKLNAVNRAQAVAQAILTGIID